MQSTRTYTYSRIHLTYDSVERGSTLKIMGTGDVVITDLIDHEATIIKNNKGNLIIKGVVGSSVKFKIMDKDVRMGVSMDKVTFEKMPPQSTLQRIEVYDTGCENIGSNSLDIKKMRIS